MLHQQKIDAAVIGVSAGGVAALQTILSALPSTLCIPLAVVQHMPSNSGNFLPNYLNDETNLQVREAEDKEPLVRGIVYIAPPDYHLQIERDRTLSLSYDPAVNHSRPSIDVLFRTAADAFGSRLAGVVLTGANFDGVEGLLNIYQNGGIAIVQDPTTAQSAAMPQAALAKVPQAKVVELEAISSLLLELSGC